MFQYPLALPSTNFRGFRMEMEDAVGRTRSPFTFSEQQFAWEGARWLAGFSLPPLTRAQADAWLAFMAALRGTEGRFLFGDPFRAAQRGSLDIADSILGVQIDEDAPSGFTLATRGWTPDATGVLLQGDMFQAGYGEFARLYMVTADVDADAGGLATIDIWPRWRKDVSAETPAEILTDPGFENWTGGVADDWADNAEAGSTFAEGSTTPSPHGGSRYMDIQRTAAGFSQIWETGLALIPGMPYRMGIWFGKDTPANFSNVGIQNNTNGEHLITKRYGNSALSVDGDVWVPTAAGGVAAWLQAASADTWYERQFGLIIPTKYAAGDTWKFYAGVADTAEIDVYFDDATLYGPSFDGTALEFTSPKGLFRLQENRRGWSVDDLVTYGVAVQAVEAFP